MATPAAPAGGARNGAGPEWGGFEENIQVIIAPRLRPGASGFWARLLLLSAQVRRSVGVRHGTGLEWACGWAGFTGQNHTVCAQPCIGVGKDKGNGHFCSPLGALVGKVGERRVWKTGNRFPSLEKTDKQPRVLRANEGERMA